MRAGSNANKVRGTTRDHITPRVRHFQQYMGVNCTSTGLLYIASLFASAALNDSKWALRSRPTYIMNKPPSVLTGVMELVKIANALVNMLTKIVLFLLCRQNLNVTNSSCEGQTNYLACACAAKVVGLCIGLIVGLCVCLSARFFS